MKNALVNLTVEEMTKVSMALCLWKKEQNKELISKVNQAIADTGCNKEELKEIADSIVAKWKES